MKTRKFMQTVTEKTYSQLQRITRSLQIPTVQRLIADRVVPDWLEKQRLKERDRRRRHVRLSRREPDS